MKEELKVGICQMTSLDDPLENARFIEDVISASEEVDLWSFPENCLFLRAGSGGDVAAMELSHPAVDRIQRAVDRRGCEVHLGSLPLRGEGGKNWNSTVWLTPGGNPQRAYDKIHLFDHAVGAASRESDAFWSGREPSMRQVKGWRMGLAIGYDLRFAELFSAYASAGVDAILLPAAFLVPTGKAHWEILLRARAIESQCYMVAAAQAGSHRFADGKVRFTHGHSMAVGPWGEVIWESKKDGPDHQVVVLTKHELESVRGRLPMHGHRRLKP
jgi:predicted amidohydrolase